MVYHNPGPATDAALLAAVLSGRSRGSFCGYGAETEAAGNRIRIFAWLI
jgi:hypothetical protein